MHYLYPRLVALHDLNTETALPQMVETSEGTVVEKIRMPSCMRNSYHFMEASGLYLIGGLLLFFPFTDR
jgi:protein transport protein SEC24